MRSAHKTLVILGFLFLLHLTFVEADFNWLKCPTSTNRKKRWEEAEAVGKGEGEGWGTSFGFPIPHSNEKFRELQRKAERITRKFQPKKQVLFARDSSTSYQSQCAKFPVPLNHSDPSGPTIDLFVKCYVLSPSSTGQFWILQGGPGASSSEIEFLMNYFVLGLEGSYDVCTLDHRGVDRSAFLNCDATEALTPGSPGQCSLVASEASECASEISSPILQLYSSTQAALDVGMIIQAYQNASTKNNVAIYGVSYGTFWVARIAQNFPDLAQALIFDSVVNPVGSEIFSFDKWDVNSDAVIKKILSWCASDSYCSGKLGSDPLNFALQTFTKVFTKNSCPKFTSLVPDVTTLAVLFQTFVTDSYLRILIPALIYRINLCRSQDINVLNNLASLVNPPKPSYCSREQNDILYTNVVAQEIFDPTITLDLLNKQNAGLDFPGNTSLGIFQNNQQWTGYFDYAHYNTPVSTSAYVLVLGGDLDGQTPIAYSQAFAKAITSSKGVYFAECPYGNHGVVKEVNPDGTTCGINIVLAFVKNPSTQPDTSCLNNTYLYGFPIGIPAVNEEIVGAEDLYDGDLITSTLPLTRGLIASAVLAGIFFLVVIILVFLLFLRKRK